MEKIMENKFEQAVDFVVKETHFSEPRSVGKVRDTYARDSEMLMITTDRLSAFDRVLTAVPFKGQVLNQVSAWWFEQTKHIIPNHVIDVPDANVMRVKKCKVFPVEVIVRAYLTGTTSTSIWTKYQEGEREFSDITLGEGLKKNSALPKAIITPTTKDDEHDEALTEQEIIERKLMTPEQWTYIREKALALFEFGRQHAAKNGLILVDTKYEFAQDEDGNILLVDEIHTPDSSRYWDVKSYDERLAQGKEPSSFDKEVLRLWYREHSDPYKDKVLPEAPHELVQKVSQIYVSLYEMITGLTFKFPDIEQPIEQRIKSNVKGL